MKASTVEFKENEIVIVGAKSPMIIRIVLGILMVIFLLIPIFVAIYRVSEGLGLHFSIVLIAAFTWAFAYFFLRTILWNSFGKEIITLTPEFIEYEADYKLFKGAKVAISGKDLEFTYIEMEKETQTFIICDAVPELIENVLPISIHNMRKLESKITDYYRKLT
ncbi:hypothetical protein H2O64_09425 [Kordia sp. YSTF-M3]|uniref:YcxB-like protein domain-containing protein n=1 Tax=Kordia aestuariivivens TaxID=2759037 RepID=A0ABR7Q8L0_9FLAO|nr:hypothetical protein [Kordia aestuariivivens]MBC8754890.1 hypothetical protein [Kordia aestuariivivens]